MNRFTAHHHTHPAAHPFSRCDVCGLPRFLARLVGGAR